MINTFLTLTRTTGFSTLRLLLTCIVLTFFADSPARANMGRPPWWGEGGSEHFLELKHIRIDSESLTIDLRPLAVPTGHSNVTARYYIDNPDTERTVQLVFFSPGIVDSTGEIEFDGVLQSYSLEDISSERADNRSTQDRVWIPESWSRTRFTPLPGTDKLLPYSVSPDDKSYVMTLRIPAGRHSIRVHFSPEAHGDLQSDVIFWQYVYLLAPAMDWGSFGTVRATIIHPKEFLVGVTPEMHRQSDTSIVGEWPGPQHEAIALTAHVPEPITWDMYLYLLAGFIGFCALTIFIGEKQLPKFRRGWGQLFSIPIATLLAIGFDFFIGFCNMIPRWRAGSQSSYHPGYEFIGYILYFFVFSFIFGCLYLWTVHRVDAEEDSERSTDDYTIET